MNLLDTLEIPIRGTVHNIARVLNKLSGGHLSPNFITLVGLAAHLLIAWMIATTRCNVQAGLLLIFFGLFDVLDGELARLQKRASSAGMLLDASADRMKEIFLYTGILVASLPPSSQMISGDSYQSTFLVPIALGGSLLVSYIKAKGETAVKDSGLSPNEINRLFQDGLGRFQVRIALIALGLLTGNLFMAVGLIVLITWPTAIWRLIKISRKLA